MHRFDVIVVGGGPAGSSCAKRLAQRGISVAVLERMEFPRTKLCAGWVTPEAIEELEFDPESYPHRFNTFDEILGHIGGFTFKSRNPQHSIRRYEFDDYLLKNSGAEVFQHDVKDIRKDGKRYILNEEFSCAYLVGAGGTRCPVYRTIFRAQNPRARHLQVATLEHEFPYEWTDPRCQLWFCSNRLPGYAWYVPKANGYLNCGIGANADKLKTMKEDLKAHWRAFCETLENAGLLEGYDADAKGYSYYLRGNVDVVNIDNAYIVGDAVGLATRDLAEGIGPAIRSGLLAAESIATGSEYSLQDLVPYSAENSLVRKVLEYTFIKRKVRPRANSKMAK
jgi:flavin-dependent dehydrogenase